MEILIEDSLRKLLFDDCDSIFLQLLDEAEDEKLSMFIAESEKKLEKLCFPYINNTDFQGEGGVYIHLI